MQKLIVYWFNISSTVNKRDAVASIGASEEKFNRYLFPRACVFAAYYVNTRRRDVYYPSMLQIMACRGNSKAIRCVCIRLRIGRVIIIIPRDTRHDSFVIGRRIRETHSSRAFLRMQLKRDNKLILFAAAPISHWLIFVPLGHASLLASCFPRGLNIGAVN